MKRRNKRIAVRLQRPPLDRMLRIHQELQAQKFPNAASMGNEMEISTKTVHRDVEFMRDRLRQPKPVPHKFDIAMNRFGADLHLVAHRGSVRKFLRLQFLMDAKHPIEGGSLQAYCNPFVATFHELQDRRNFASTRKSRAASTQLRREPIRSEERRVGK